MTNIAQEIVDVAHEVLARKVHVIEGVRRIALLRFQFENPVDPIFHQIITTEDETESFPLGSVRTRWSEESLRKADAELANYLRSAEVDIRRACEEIIQKLSKQ